MVAAAANLVNFFAGIPHQVWTYVVPLVLVLAVVGLLLERLSGGKGRRPFQEPIPFRGKDYFFTRSERVFFDVLVKVVDSRATIFSKVRMEDVLWIPETIENPHRWTSKVRQKHLDFVLCDPAQFKPFLVIELDGDSHLSSIQQARDAEKDAILQAAGIPLERIQVASTYPRRELQKLIERAHAQVFATERR